MHLGARGFVHAELIDPESGAALEFADGASGEPRPHPPPSSGRPAPPLPHPRPRPGADEPVSAAARLPGFAASAGPTTC